MRLERGDVGVAVANIAGAILLDDLRLVRAAQMLHQRLGDIQDGERAAGADVEDAIVHLLPLLRQQVGLHDVGDVDEITLLVAVFEDDGRLLVQQAPGEDGGDAGVWVGERLARTVGVEVAEGDDGDIVGAPDRQAHLFLIFLADGVDRSRVQRLFFIGGRRLQQLPAPLPVSRHRYRAKELPLFTRQLLGRAQVGEDIAVGGAGILSLTVDRHGRGDDQLAHPIADGGVVRQDVEEDCGAPGVHVYVALDLVHRLPDADHRRLVVDHVHALHRPLQRLPVAHIS